MLTEGRSSSQLSYRHDDRLQADSLPRKIDLVITHSAAVSLRVPPRIFPIRYPSSVDGGKDNKLSACNRW